MATTKIRSKQQLEINSDVTFGSAYRITNALDAVAAQDYVTLSQLNAIQSGLDVKASVRAASTANFVVATGGTTTIDGVSLVVGDRVLLKNQTTASENGIWVVAAGAWARSTDADTSAEVTGGMFTFVNEGTVNADSGWILTTNDVIVLNTTALTFTQFSGAGTYTAGSGLTLTGTSFSANTDGVTTGVISGNISVRSTGTAGQVMTSSGTAGTVGVWGSVNLASAAAVGSSILAVPNGGSGRTSTTAYMPIVGGSTSTGAEQSVATGTTNGQALLYQGNAALPSFGAIALGDTTGNIVAGTLRVVNGGTGQTSYTDGQLLIGNTTGNTLTKSTLTAGTGVTITNGAGAITIALSGTGTAASITGTANQVLANGTSGSAQTGPITLTLPQDIATSSSPTFKGLTLTAGSVAVSTPFLGGTQTWNGSGVTFIGQTFNITDTLSAAASKFVDYQIAAVSKFTIQKDGAVTTGIWNGTTVGTAFGGTGQTTYTDGQLLIGNSTGNTLTKATLTQGTGITITNGNGTITISSNNTGNLTISNFVFNEVPAGTIDNTNPTFAVNGNAAITAGTLRLYNNGVRQKSGAGNDYTVNNTTATITFLTGSIPQTGDVLLADYMK